MAIPTFVSEHNLSVVYKRFLESLRTYASMTYLFASSRPYHDPNFTAADEKFSIFKPKTELSPNWGKEINEMELKKAQEQVKD